MHRTATLALLLLGLAGMSPVMAQSDEGTAGVFSDPLPGRVTASGEVYDPQSFTGGSPSLRFGLRLAVTNLKTGAEITVRVNDRGPSPPGQVLNLSRGAATALGVNPGDPIRIRALRVDQPDVASRMPERTVADSPAPTAVQPPTFLPSQPPAWVQLGAFRTALNAQRFAATLVGEGLAPLIRHDGVVFRVYVTVTEGDVQALVAQLSHLGHHGFFQVAKEPGGTPTALSTP